MNKLLLSLFTVLTLFAVVPYAMGATKNFQYNPLGTLTTSLISYYNMQGSSFDYYGSNNLTDVGSPTYGTSYGKISQGVAYNGSSQYGYNSTTGLGQYSTVSFALWLKWTSTSFGYVFNLSPSAANNENFNLFVNNGAAGLIGITGTSWSANLNSAVNGYNDGNWHLIVATYNAGAAKLYIDGALSASSSPGGTNPSLGRFSLGYNVAGASGYYAGDADEPSIWTKVLSSTEVSNLYYSGAGQTMCNGTGGPTCPVTQRHKIIIISLNWKPEPIA